MDSEHRVLPLGSLARAARPSVLYVRKKQEDTEGDYAK